jgi:hypothetical protein
MLNIFKEFQEQQERKVKDIKSQESLLLVMAFLSICAIFFIDINYLPLKMFFIILCASVFTMIYILLKKINYFNYKKWYDEQSKNMINSVISKAWDSQDYDELKFILNKFPLKTLFVMFVSNSGLSWDKEKLNYKHLDLSITFLKNNPCDFNHLDSTEYTIEYIKAVLPELSQN